MKLMRDMKAGLGAVDLTARLRRARGSGRRRKQERSQKPRALVFAFVPTLAAAAVAAVRSTAPRPAYASHVVDCLPVRTFMPFMSFMV
jgi:hypothetical protein